MRFRGEPNLTVNISKPTHAEPKHIKFDDNGLFETDNPILIKRLSMHYATVAALKCKKCDFCTDDRTELMRHYKTEHKEN